MLEHEVNSRKGDSDTGTEKSATSSDTGGGELKYISGKVIPQQSMFLAAIIRALELQGRSRYAHIHWTGLVTCALPFLGTALTRIVTTVVKQLCNNIENLSKAYIQYDSHAVRYCTVHKSVIFAFFL